MNEAGAFKRWSCEPFLSNGRGMAKPNYSGEKRRKDLAKKAKKEEKRLRKLEPKTESSAENEETPTAGTSEN